MKIVKKISLFILLLLFSASTVKAEQSCDMIFTLRESRETPYWYSAGYSIGGVTNSIYNFYLKKENNTYVGSYSGFCMNPSLSTGKIKGTDTDYNCKRVIFDETVKDPNIKRYDAGLAAIGNSDYSLELKSLIVRIYPMYWKAFNSNANNVTAEYAAYKKIANDWLEDEAVKERLNKLRTLVPEGFIREGKFYGAADNANVDGIDLNEAKNLLLFGLDAAIDYDPKLDKNFTWDDVPIKSSEKIEKEDGTSATKVSVTYSFDVKNFSKEKDEIKLEFDCPTCEAKNVDYILYLNDKEIKNEDLKTLNLLTFEDSTLNETDGLLNGSFKFRIDFIGTVCDGIPYKVKMEYKDSTAYKTKLYEVEPSRGNGTGSSGSTQDFIVFSDSSSSNTLASNSRSVKQIANTVVNETTVTNVAEIEGTLYLCANPYDNSNNSCTTKISTVYCKYCNDNTNTIKIKEGYSDNPNDCTEPTEEDLNIPVCIANSGAKDKAGNRYESFELEDNPYCGIYCKEDYTIKLPGTLLVNSGQYITLAANLVGEKKCFSNSKTGTAIGDINGDNVVDFWNDLVTAAHNSIDAYNAYALAQANVDALSKDSSFTEDATDKCPATPGPSHEVCSGNPTQYRGSCPVGMKEVSGRRNGSMVYCDTCKQVSGSTTQHGAYKSIDYTTSYTYVHYDGTKESKEVTVSIPIDEDDECKDKETILEEYKDKIAEELKKKEEERGNPVVDNTVTGPKGTSTEYYGGSGAEGKLGTFGLFDIIYSLNNCSALATVVPAEVQTEIEDEEKRQDESYMITWPGYQISPEIRFWYQEDEYMAIMKNKNLMLSKIETNDEDYDLEYCLGNVNNKYECDTGWKKYPQDKDEIIGTTQIFACTGKTADSCKNINLEYSKARFVRKTLHSSANFIAPTQFYTVFTTGKIGVLNNENEEIENGDILEHQYPVDWDKNGRKTYVLTFDNLGEYYYNGHLGRLWGNDDSVVPLTLKEDNECRKDSALKYDTTVDKTVIEGGVYSCEYDVNVCDTTNSCKPADPDNGDDNWYCKDGLECSKEEYEKDCGCKPADPDNGRDYWTCKDGEKCDEEQYKNECNCPDCPVVCPSESCNRCLPPDYASDGKWHCEDGRACSKDEYEAECNNCPNGECPIVCKNCLFNDGLNVDYRPVTPNDLNPNDRELGYNWQYDDTIDSAVELKAYKTTTEIEAAGSKIYDTNSGFSKVTFKVNRQMINYIREYNKDNKEDGYYNNTLKCYDFKDTDGVVYKNIYCYSTFIDELVDNFGNEEDDNGNKMIEGLDNRLRTDSDRKLKSQTSGYWTTWAENREDAKNWEVTTKVGIENYFANYKSIGIGPAWK